MRVESFNTQASHLSFLHVLEHKHDFIMDTLVRGYLGLREAVLKVIGEKL